MKRSHLMIATAVLLLVIFAGYWLKPFISDHGFHTPVNVDGSIQDDSIVQDASGKTVLFWYDPMVPGQKFDKPGKSPFMDMMLVPKYAETEAQDGGVRISSQTMQNLGIRLAGVEMASFTDRLSAVGRIEPDERLFYSVQPRIAGFVDRLLVRAVGDPVSKGQKIAEIYAPELLAAQHEYLALLDYRDVDIAEGLVQAAHGRLSLLGMTQGEIAAIARNRRVTERFGVYAPASGVVSELSVREGAQLMSGTPLIKIADLSRVWLIAEVPERDIMRLKPGIAAKVELQSLPGEVFAGEVNYIYPTLDEVSRTARVRVELGNRAGLLRPGMYGNLRLEGVSRDALSIPSESVITTGIRKVVIIRQGSGFMPVTVETGQEHEGRTEILAGLDAGETVVASGQFLIDSEASLSGVLDRLAQQPEALAEMDAEDAHAGHDLHDMSAEESMPEGTGKVIELDVRAGKVVLAHDPIAALEWPSMTMGFRVSDPRQLHGITSGDQVQFSLRLDSQSGQYDIADIRRRGGAR